MLAVLVFAIVALAWVGIAKVLHVREVVLPKGETVLSGPMEIRGRVRVRGQR